MTQYIAIDGRGGSGKTYFSEQLAKALNAPVFHLDKYGSDFVPFIGLPILKRIVEESAEDIVIYEGVGVFDDRFDELHPYKIFVDTPEQLRNQRLSSRDVPRFDRTTDDWKLIGEIWSAAEGDYFAGEPSKKANIIVGSDGTDIDVATVIDAYRQQVASTNVLL